MIPKSLLLVAFACVVMIQGISGATYSNVFVQGGVDAVPLEYVKYGPPAVTLAGSQLAQLSAAPVSALVSPCVAPCVIPGAPVSAVAPITSTANAKIVAYKSPISNVPVVLANKDDAAGYQYAYAVYDESTGDKKAQSEQSDGSMVQGKYSFIQPDGYRREVVYTADDLKGFNAVVRNFLPETDGTQSVAKDKDIKNPKDDKKEAPPCNDAKSEQLKVAPKEEPQETANKEVEQIEMSPQKQIETSSQPTEVVTSPAVATNGVVSYDEVIKCLQAKLQTNNSPSAVSPLTYILIPSLSGFSSPC